MPRYLFGAVGPSSYAPPAMAPSAEACRTSWQVQHGSQRSPTEGPASRALSPSSGPVVLKLGFPQLGDRSRLL